MATVTVRTVIRIHPIQAGDTPLRIVITAGTLRTPTTIHGNFLPPITSGVFLFHSYPNVAFENQGIPNGGLLGLHKLLPFY